MPKISFLGARKTVFLIFAATFIFAAGYALGFEGFIVESTKFPKVTISRQTPPDKTDVDFSLFWHVWDALSASYYDKTKLNPANMVYGAISGMVSAVGDPYTMFLTPGQNKVVNEDLDGSFGGVGIELGYKGAQLAVMSVLPNTPAEKAGVMAGDLIAGIKDKAKKLDTGTAGISLSEAVSDIRGQKGTVVTLTLLRDQTNDPIIVSLTRDTVTVPSVTLKFLGQEDGVSEGVVADLKLAKFGSETNKEWNDAVTQILKNGQVRGLILDLRNNPGGYMQGAVDVGSDLLPNGSLVVTEDKSGERTEYKTSKIGLLTKMPLVVLINGGSASASEILAGALRDDLKIKLVGEASFGKGTIQEPQELEGGSGLHITIARWLTPQDTWVNGKGLEPDVKISDDVKTSEDEQLKEALKLVLSEIK
jgi:carboxyl-terminal processing protease